MDKERWDPSNGEGCVLWACAENPSCNEQRACAEAQNNIILISIRKLLDWYLLKVKLSWSFFYREVRKSESR